LILQISSWSRIPQISSANLEDPLKEVSAMQLIGDYHPNVIGAMEVLQDDQYLYTVMPFCSGGDLFTNLNCHELHSIDEDKARIWFQQLLDALIHLQLKGVSHRDLSLENLMIDGCGNLCLIDFGMALRVPFTDPCNFGYVTDVSEGTERRLIRAQGQVGKLMYMAPEIMDGEVFDGFAMDLWAAGVILFVLLIGMAPFKWAHESDTRYAKIAKGELRELLEGHKISISKEACDLLQQMFWQDPRKRLTLAQILKHPWVYRKRRVSSKDDKSAIMQSKKGLDPIVAS
jgi:serine/threonine protein kinase